MFIQFRGRHFQGAWFALALMLLGSLLPALGPAGLWLCGNNTPCPWMNKVAARPEAPQDISKRQDAPQKAAARHACCKTKPGPCCPTSAVALKSSQSESGCRLVSPPQWPSADRLLAKTASGPETLTPAPAPRPLSDLLRPDAEANTPRPLPLQASLPPHPESAPQSLRAPPLG